MTSTKDAIEALKSVIFYATEGGAISEYGRRSATSAFKTLETALTRCAELEKEAEELAGALAFSLPYLDDLEDGSMKGFTNGLKNAKQALENHAKRKEGV